MVSADPHLQSPIQADLRRGLVECWNALGESQPHYLSRICAFLRKHPVSEGRTLRWDSESLMPYLWGFSEVTEDEEIVSLIVSASDRIIREEIKALSKLLIEFRTTAISKLKDSWSTQLSPNSRQYGAYRVRLGRVHAQVRNLVKQTPTAFQKITNLRDFELYWGGPIGLLVNIRQSDEIFLVDYHQFTGVLDTVIGRWCVLLTLETHLSYKDEYLPSISAVSDIWSWGDQLISRHGNNAYKVLKHFESNLVGMILYSEDASNAGQDYAWAMSREMSDALGELDDGAESHLITVMRRLFPKMPHRNVLVEIYGMYRLWSHPTVSAAKGGVKYKTLSRTTLPLQMEKVETAHGNARFTFVKNYIRGRGSWPPCSSVSCLRGTFTDQLVKTHGLNLETTRMDYSVREWNHVIFHKTFEFDYFLDMSDILDDKSISPLRDDWQNVLRPWARSGTTRMPESSRRALLEFLRRDDFNLEEIIKKFQTGAWNSSEYIMILNPKEREMNETPRMFASLTLNARCVLLACEKNISNTLLRYYPEIVMTKTEAELHDIINSMTRGGVLDPYFSIFVNIDFSKWNLRFRNSNAGLFYDFLDQIFGMPNLWTRIHNLIKNAIIIVQSEGGTIPVDIDGDPVECDLAWHGHDAVAEGLLQKCWCIITGGLIKTVSDRLGLSMKLIGAGDNQVLSIKIPKPSGIHAATYIGQDESKIRAIIEKCRTELDRESDGCGLPLNIEETWGAASIFAFGKRFVIHGAPASGCIKRISRILPLMADPYPNLQKEISALQGTGQAAAVESFEPITARFVSLVETCLLIENFRRTSKGKYNSSMDLYERMYQRITREEAIDRLCYLSTLPRVFGGYSTQCLLGMTYRGHPDPLSLVIEQIKLLSGDYNWTRALKQRIDKPNLDLSADFRQLLMSPTSLPLRDSDNGMGLVRRELEEALKVYTNNRDFRAVFEMNTKKMDDEFVDYLRSIKPIDPRVLSEIYACSPAGAVANIIGYFNNARTATGLLGPIATSLEKTVERNDLTTFAFLHQRYLEDSHPYTRTRHDCSTAYAQILRNRAWAKPDADIVGITKPHPASYARTYEVVNGHCAYPNCTNTHCVVTTVDATPDQEASGHLFGTRGIIEPLLGHRTVEKRTSAMIDLPVKSRPLIQARRLSQISTWAVDPKSPLRDNIRQLIASRSDLTQDLLDQMTPTVYGGLTSHRLQDPYTKHTAAVNHSGAHPSHVYHSTDDVRDTEVDVSNIHFQGLLFHIEGLLNLEAVLDLRSSADCFRVYHTHFECQTCLEPPSNHLLTSDFDMPPPPDLSVSRLLFTPSRSLMPLMFGQPFRTSSTCIESLFSPGSPRATTLLPQIIVSELRLAVGTISAVDIGGRTSQVVSRAVDISLAELARVSISDFLTQLTVVSLGMVLRNCTGYKRLPSIFEIQDYVGDLAAELINPIAHLLTHRDVRSRLSQEIPIVDGLYHWSVSIEGVKKAIRYASRFDVMRLHEEADCPKNLMFWPTNRAPKLVFVAESILAGMMIKYYYVLNASWDKLRKVLPSIASEEILDPNNCKLRVTQILIDCMEVIHVSSILNGCYPEVTHLPLEIWRYSQRQKNALEMTRISLESYDATASIRNISLEIQMAPLSVPISFFASPAVSIETVRFPATTLYRLVGKYQTSHLKWIELLSGLPPPSIVLSCGDGEGGATLIASHYFPRAIIQIIPFMRSRDFDHHRATSYCPSELLGTSAEERVTTRLDFLGCGGDICTEEFWCHVEGSNLQDGLFICDAEISSEQNEVYLRRVRAYLQRSPVVPSYFICKCFADDKLMLVDWLRGLGCRYTEISLVRPLFTEASGNEYYFIARRPHSKGALGSRLVNRDVSEIINWSQRSLDQSPYPSRNPGLLGMIMRINNAIGIPENWEISWRSLTMSQGVVPSKTIESTLAQCRTLSSLIKRILPAQCRRATKMRTAGSVSARSIDNLPHMTRLISRLYAWRRIQIKVNLVEKLLTVGPCSFNQLQFHLTQIPDPVTFYGTTLSWNANYRFTARDQRHVLRVIGHLKYFRS